MVEQPRNAKDEVVGHSPAGEMNSDVESGHSVALFPFVALYPQATNIHPSRGRLVSLDAVAFDAAGEVGEEFHAIFNVGGDPGPRHTHGVEPGLFDRAPKFARHLKALDQLIDGRILVVHDAPFAWGMLVSEARRAMNAAARANRSRNRRQGRRRQRVGHVPQPAEIVDTLEVVRRRGEVPVDTRLEAVARTQGVNAQPAVASAKRAKRAEEETSRERSLIVKELFLTLRSGGPIAGRAPSELAADRFGLQRSRLRVDAEKAEPRTGNPGQFTAKSGLRPGMEVVVTDDIVLEHDGLIEAIIELGMTYSEKLTRETSLVVTNASGSPGDLRGKAMHAYRKKIPLVRDAEFLGAVETARGVTGIV